MEVRMATKKFDFATEASSHSRVAAKAISRKRFTTKSQRSQKSEEGRQKTGGAFDKDIAIE